jgi:hypothetical protein
VVFGDMVVEPCNKGKGIMEIVNDGMANGGALPTSLEDTQPQHQPE